MKAFLILILIAAIGFALYFFLNKDENFEVTDRITVTQPSGMDESAPSVSTPPSYVTVEGTITNKSEKDFMGIELVYKVHTETLKVSLGNLKKGESINFKSSPILIRDKNPEHKLIDIIYNE